MRPLSKAPTHFSPQFFTHSKVSNSKVLTDLITPIVHLLSHCPAELGMFWAGTLQLLMKLSTFCSPSWRTRHAFQKKPCFVLISNEKRNCGCLDLTAGQSWWAFCGTITAAERVNWDFLPVDLFQSLVKKKVDVNPAVLGGAEMKKTLVNCEAVSFADALLIKVSQSHLFSCQTP